MKTMKEEVQGVLTWGHSDMHFASYIVVNIPKTAKPVAFLAEVMDEVIYTHQRPDNNALNIAMTHSGLSKFGLPESTLDNFSREFKEGMNTPHRSFLLGDVDDNRPEEWFWGAPEQESADLLLMVFGETKELVENTRQKYLQRLSDHGLVELMSIPSEDLPDAKEHFGFRDGIGQPKIEGISKLYPKPTPADRQYDPSKKTAPFITTGEAVLGYKNQYAQYGRNALVTDQKGDLEVLPIDNAGSKERSFGQNGSYMIFRQLFQDVYKFWDFLREEASSKGDFETDVMIKYGAKMVGRWPNGAPLTLAPDSEPVGFPLEKMDKFLYAPTDIDGYKCPRGSHLRRSNPRDALDPSPEGSLKITDKHRMLRRGRPYGPPLAPSMDPSEMLKKGADNGERGLVFVAFVGDISRQYEFTQHDWNNAPKFDNLYSENDPVIGNHFKKDNCPLETTNFTMQGCPVRHRMNDLPNFVKTRGGAYFFLPSMSALKYLTTL